MKRTRRTADPDEPAAKKQRTRSQTKPGGGGGNDDAGQRTAADNPFRPTLQRKATDICEEGVTEGFVQLNVAMITRLPAGALRIMANVVENGHLVQFDVAFLRQTAELLAEAGVDFDMDDTIWVSLKGAQLEEKHALRQPKGSTVKLLPMALNFSEGVCLKFVYKKSPLPTGPLVDLWAHEEEQQPVHEPKKPTGGLSTGDAPFEDDWFLTPVLPVPSSQDAAPVSSQPPAAPPDSSPAPPDSSPAPPDNSPAEEPRVEAQPATDAEPAAVDAPVQDESPALLSGDSENSAAPEKQPEPAKPAPPRKLYRSIPGRPARNAAPAPKAAKKKKGATNASEVGPKAASPPVLETGPTPEAEADSSNVPQPKKTQKKKAREAKKAARLDEQQQPEAGQEVGTSVEHTREPTPAQEPGAKPAASTSVESIAAANVAGPSTASGNTGVADTPLARPSSAAPKETSTPSTAAGKARSDTPLARSSSAAPKEPSAPAAPAPTPKTSEKVPAKAASVPSRMLSSSLPSSQNPELDLEAGCRGDSGQIYTPLSSLSQGYDQATIGVIASTGGDSRRTKTDEWCTKLVLVDPSNAAPDDLHRGFAVTCFAKSPAGLPQAARGDVLVLTGMRVEDWHGRAAGVCASYSAWAWTLFVPATGRTVRAHEHGPALGAAEARYCIALGDWWRAVLREQERALAASGVVVHQIGEGDARGWGARDSAGAGAGGRPSIARAHRLMRDAGPAVHPNGYFDCTVEVLHGHTNANGVYSLYVTDYTANERAAPTTAGWCAPALAPYVMRVELWDAAAERGPELRPGEYYEMTNARMKVSSGAFWEVKFTEGRKLRKLDEDELEGEPHLAALLERKKKWEEEAEEKGAHRFPDQLISEAQLDSHFCCTVEVLQTKQKDSGARALLWVTDYTSRTDLAPLAATAEWAHGIGASRILKIALTDAQAQVAAGLEPGDVVAIRNLRLKALAGGKDVAGVLGGAERLIFKLNAQTTGSEACLALLSRKKAWERRKDGKANGQTKGTANGKGSAALARKKQRGLPAEPVQRPSGAISFSKLRELHDGSKPMRYRVVGRVTDHFPNPISKWTVLRCTQCKEDIPETFRICTRCDSDMADTHVRPFYKFWLEIEDEEGTREQIAGALPSAPFLPDFLADLPPVDLEEDDEALQKFTDRLRTYLGSDLVDNYGELLQNAKDGSLDASDAPLLSLLIGATPGDDPHLTLLKCSLLE